MRKSAPERNCLRPFAEGHRIFSRGGEQRKGQRKCERQMESAQPETRYKHFPRLPWRDSRSHAKASTPEELEQGRQTSTSGKPSDARVKSKPRWNKNARNSTTRGEQETRQFLLRDTAQCECPPLFLSPQIKQSRAPMDERTQAHSVDVRHDSCGANAVRVPRAEKVLRRKRKSPTTQSARPSGLRG
jgi:hypothetical protein